MNGNCTFLRIIVDMSKILVIVDTVEKTRYKNGKIYEEKGTRIVSHGVNLDTGKVVILPPERWEQFQHYCYYEDGEWYLK
jgi:hypothetical protein